MNDIEKAVKEYATIAHKIPPAPELPVLEPEEVCACGKKVNIKLFEKLNTGVKVILNNVCKGCANGAKIDKDTAKVVCCKCGRIVCRLEPGTDPVDGFVIKAGKSLHVANCSACDPEAKENTQKAYPIIEKLIWYKKKNKLTST